MSASSPEARGGRQLLSRAIEYREHAESEQRFASSLIQIVETMDAKARKEHLERNFNAFQSATDMRNLDIGASERRSKERQREIDRLRRIRQALNSGEIAAKLAKHLDLSELMSKSYK